MRNGHIARACIHVEPEPTIDCAYTPPWNMHFDTRTAFQCPTFGGCPRVSEARLIEACQIFEAAIANEIGIAVADESVIPSSTTQSVSTNATKQLVVARSAVENIVASVTKKFVIAIATVEGVVALANSSWYHVDLRDHGTVVWSIGRIGLSLACKDDLRRLGGCYESEFASLITHRLFGPIGRLVPVEFCGAIACRQLQAFGWRTAISVSGHIEANGVGLARHGCHLLTDRTRR